MVSFLIPILVGILEKLATEKFFATILVQLCGAWAKQSVNDYDNAVVKAMAEALGVEPPK